MILETLHLIGIFHIIIRLYILRKIFFHRLHFFLDCLLFNFLIFCFLLFSFDIFFSFSYRLCSIFFFSSFCLIWCIRLIHSPCLVKLQWSVLFIYFCNRFRLSRCCWWSKFKCDCCRVTLGFNCSNFNLLAHSWWLSYFKHWAWNREGISRKCYFGLVEIASVYFIEKRTELKFRVALNYERAFQDYQRFKGNAATWYTHENWLHFNDWFGLVASHQIKCLAKLRRCF